jgi:hypothetical protein
MKKSAKSGTQATFLTILADPKPLSQELEEEFFE